MRGRLDVIFLLTHLRFHGYVFKPVSFYYCYDRVENHELIMAEVNNIFGDSHNYWLDASKERRTAAGERYTTPK